MRASKIAFTTVIITFLASPTSVAEEKPLFDHSYAVVIGINTYSSLRWPKLNYARKDAEAIASVMKVQGYDVVELYDAKATRASIISILGDLAKKLHTNDRVFFFFAGHGYTTRSADTDWGYIVPFDGDDDATLISMEEFAG